jgi:hypothetical protein
MKLTIIPSDGAVYVDGVSYVKLDLSSCGIPSDVHAFQWYETEGEVEFSGSPKPQNELISELPAWASACVNKWNETKAAYDVAIAAHAAANANTQS